ncbi:MAG: hypothetical protein ABIH72_00055 [archaeon]
MKRYTIPLIASFALVVIFFITASTQVDTNQTITDNNAPITIKVKSFFKDLYEIMFGKKSITGNAIGGEAIGYTLGFLVLLVVIIILYIIVRRKTNQFKKNKQPIQKAPSKKVKKKKR